MPRLKAKAPAKRCHAESWTLFTGSPVADTVLQSQTDVNNTGETADESQRHADISVANLSADNLQSHPGADQLQSIARAKYVETASLLADFDFYVSVDVFDDSKQIELKFVRTGKMLEIGLRTPCCPPTLPEHRRFWMYFSRSRQECIVYFEACSVHRVRNGRAVKNRRVVDEVEYFYAAPAQEYALLSYAAKIPNLVSFSLFSYCSQSGKLVIELLISRKMIHHLEHPSDIPRSSSCEFRKVVEYICQLDSDEWENSADVDATCKNIEDLYRYLKVSRESEESDYQISANSSNPQHACLRPVLRQYQIRAVRWMLRQELRCHHTPADPNDLHPLYREVTINGAVYYYNVYGGWFSVQKPVRSADPAGGILADEMGLGKTVEVLSLILCHQRSDVPRVELREVKQADQCIEQATSPRKRNRKRTPSLSSIKANSDSDKSAGSVLSDFGDELGSDESSNSSTDFVYVADRLSRGERLIQRQQRTKPDSAVSSQSGSIGVITGSEAANSSPSSDSKNLDTYDCESGETTGNTDTQLSAIDTKCSKQCWDDAVQEVSPDPSLDPHHSYDVTIDEVMKRYCGDRSCTSKRSRPRSNSTRSKPVSSARRMAQLHYEQALAAYAHRPPQRRSRLDIDDVPTDFSCLCGRWRSRKQRSSRSLITCEMCGTRQHADCVGYDLRNPNRGPYFCPQCWTRRSPLKSAATLIVSPTAICQQWVAEIEKHIVAGDLSKLSTVSRVSSDPAVSSATDSDISSCERENPTVSGSEGDEGVAVRALRVLVYEGVRGNRYIQPQTLADYDVVVTTYSVLQREIHYVDVGRAVNKDNDDEPACDTPQHHQRRTQRYMPPPTPLLRVQWWRVCLDEAQMVECTTTRTSEMALRLSSVYRWCVTGTPTSRSFDDLYGLLLFIGADPASSRRWWQQCYLSPMTERGDSRLLRQLLMQCLWRSCKADVADQIGIPAQTQCCTWLSFAPIESYFYRWQRVNMSRPVLQRVAGLTGEAETLRLVDIDRGVMATLLHSLTCLRRACCHPQSGGSHTLRNLQLTQSRSPAAVEEDRGDQRNWSAPLTMDQLLEQMVKRTTVAAEEAHRQRTAALCGLAALHVVSGQPEQAVALYRSVLREADQLSSHSKISTDLLQRLHAAHNLHEVLTTMVTLTSSSSPVTTTTTTTGSCSAALGTVAPTLRDAQLPDLCRQLRCEYLQRHESAVIEARRQWTLIADDVESSVDASITDWIGDVMIAYEQQRNKGTHGGASDSAVSLVVRIKDTITQFNNNCSKTATNEKTSVELATTKRAKSLQQRRPLALSLINLFSSTASLRVLLVARWSAVEEQRVAVASSIGQLLRADPSQLVNAAVDCHLREVSSNGGTNSRRRHVKSGQQPAAPPCAVCEANEPLCEYERQLFDIRAGHAGWNVVASELVEHGADTEPLTADSADSATHVHGQLARGSWRDNEVGHVIRQLLSIGRQLSGGDDGVGVFSDSARAEVVAAGNRHVKRLELLQREFRLLRALWARVSDRVAACDELNMATTRLRLRYPDEEVGDSRTQSTTSFSPLLPIHVLEPGQLETHKITLEAERAASHAECLRLLGQRLYLCNLQRSGAQQVEAGAGVGDGDSDARQHNCPICERSLGTTWCVLQCGHSFCFDCVQTLFEEYASVVGKWRRIRCAVCRDWCAENDAAFVRASGSDAPVDADNKQDSCSVSADCEPSAEELEKRIVVRGGHSTKIAAVVRRVLSIRRDDDTAKILVFATWTDVLDVCAFALQQNGVSVRRLHAPGQFQSHLRQFRHDPSVHVLLLSIGSGARGLNLTEATHVVLVNPVLDPAAELQALGRVHRIGQTRPTFVHRLLVRDSIEERIHAFNAARDWDNSATKAAGKTTAVTNALDGQTDMTLTDFKSLFTVD